MVIPAFEPFSDLVLVDTLEYQPTSNIQNVIYLSDNDVPLGSISLPLFIEENAEQLRSEYIDFINQVAVNLDAEKKLEVSGFSFWWASLLSEKSVWKSKDIYLSFKYLALNKLVSLYHGTHVLLVSKDTKIIKLVGEITSNYNLSLSLEKNTCRISSQTKKRHLTSAAGILLREIVRFRKVIFENLKSKKNNFLGNNIFFTYSLGLNKEQLENGYFSSPYWSGLESEINKSGSTVILIYIPDNNFPKIDSLINSRNLGKEKSNQNIYVLEELYSLKIIAKSLWTYFSVFRKAYTIKKECYLEPATLTLISEDWKESFYGKEAMKSALRMQLIKEFVLSSKSNPTSKLFYLYENQPWELMLLNFWDVHSRGLTFGFQHVGGKFFDMKPFNLESQPKPSKILVNGELAKKYLCDNDFGIENVMIVESIRNLFLAKHANDMLKGEERASILLIVTDYSKSATLEQLVLIREAWDRISALFDKVVIKSHPATPVGDILFNLSFPHTNNLEVTNKDLRTLFEQQPLVYTSNFTNASIESAALGLKTIVNVAPDSFNMSPLRGVKGVQFVSTSSALLDAISQTDVPTVDHDFFSLDDELPRWKALLS